MNKTFLYDVPAVWLALMLFVLIIVANWGGFHYRKNRLKKTVEKDNDWDGFGTIEGAMLGLMALMLAFTFNMAASKFETRRELVINESNCISTALLRCDIYPDSARIILREQFKEYLDTRIAYYNAEDDETKIKAALEGATLHFQKIWNLVTHLSQDVEKRLLGIQMLPALNAMNDIVTTREAARVAEVPPLIVFTLVFITFSASFLLGYGTKSKNRNITIVIAFALMTSLVLYLIMELDRPRRGIINIDSAERTILELESKF